MPVAFEREVGRARKNCRSRSMSSDMMASESEQLVKECEEQQETSNYMWIEYKISKERVVIIDENEKMKEKGGQKLHEEIRQCQNRQKN